MDNKEWGWEQTNFNFDSLLLKKMYFKTPEPSALATEKQLL